MQGRSWAYFALQLTARATHASARPPTLLATGRNKQIQFREPKWRHSLVANGGCRPLITSAKLFIIWSTGGRKQLDAVNDLKRKEDDEKEDTSLEGLE